MYYNNQEHIFYSQERVTMITELENLQKKLDSQDIEITIDDLVQWKDHPVTKRLTADFLQQYLQELEYLSTNVPTNDDTRALHASTVGRMDVYKRFIDYVEDEKAEIRESKNDD